MLVEEITRLLEQREQRLRAKQQLVLTRNGPQHRDAFGSILPVDISAACRGVGIGGAALSVIARVFPTACEIRRFGVNGARWFCMYDVLTYTRSLIQGRVQALSELDEQRNTLSSADYLSCRRSLLRAIEELQQVVSNIEFQRAGCTPPINLPGLRKPCVRHDFCLATKKNSS